jgi:predicted ArsR family transcriptional regulator
MNRESSEDVKRPWKLMELLVDPVRAKIYFEVLVRGELTAQELMNKLSIARSTLTHHLTRFVQAEVFKVRVDAVGRPVKHYRLRDDFEETVVVDGREPDSEALQRKIAFMESAAAHMQMIANLARMTARQISEEASPKTKDEHQIIFAFNMLSDEDAEVWTRHHRAFLSKVQSELGAMRRTEQQKTQVAFSGLVRIPRDRSVS